MTYTEKIVTPAAHREAATCLPAANKMGEQQACLVLGGDSTSVRYRTTIV